MSSFIHGCRNIVWLSGYARRLDGGTLLLSQSRHDGRAFPIAIAPPLRCPRPNEACEVKCHIYSEHTPEGSRVWLEAVYIKRASVTATPVMLSILNGLRRKEAVAESPFATREEVFAELKESMNMAQPAVESLLSSTRKIPRNDGFLNRVILSGFLGNKRFIPPAEGSWDDFGSLMFELRQSQDPTQAHRIGIPGAGKRFGTGLGRLYRPLAVDAKLYVDPVLAEDGTTILDRRLRIETTQLQVSTAQRSRDFVGNAFPQWWLDIVNAQGEQSASPPAFSAAPDTPSAPASALAPVEQDEVDSLPALPPSPETEFEGVVQHWD